jgi:regulatory protein
VSTWGQSRRKVAGRRDGVDSGERREDEIVDISDEAFWEPRPRDIGWDSKREKTEEEVPAGLDAFPEDTELEITSVLMLKRPKHRYRISFGAYALEVHEDVMIKYRMIKGAVFTKEELEEIVAADERQQGYADALKYLSLKPRTTYEIAQRLGEKGWGEETIQDVLTRLQSEGYVNDAAYAQEWASQRVKLRGKGKLWVKHELRQKGISKAYIEEALGEVSEEDEFESALQLGMKKWRSTTGELLDRKRKTGAFLQRRGYSGSVVSRVMRELGNREEMHGMDEWDEE